MKYLLIKITDNNNIENFIIISSKLNDWRIAVSILKSQAKLYFMQNKGKYKPVFEYFKLDYSASCVYKNGFNNLEEVDEKIQELTNFYIEKLKRI